MKSEWVNGQLIRTWNDGTLYDEYGTEEAMKRIDAEINRSESSTNSVHEEINNGARKYFSIPCPWKKS